MGLAYDSSAFLYFLVAVLVTFLVPATLSVVRRVRGRFGPPRRGRTAVESKKLAALAARPLPRGFLVLACVVAAAWCALLAALYSLSIGGNGAVMAFDPFAILELPEGATPQVPAAAAAATRARARTRGVMGRLCE